MSIVFLSGFRATAVVAFGAVLIGCATTPTPPPYDPRHSEALNIARAAGMDDIRDLPWVKYQEIVADKKMNSGQIDQRSLIGPSISALSVYFGNVKPLGLSAGKAGALDFVMNLSKPNKASSQSRLIAWMPIEMAANEEDAQKRMTAIFVSAIKNAAAEMKWPPGIRVEEERIQIDLAERKGRTKSIVVHLTGDSCDLKTVRCAYAFWLGTMSAKRQASPAALGSVDSYAFLALNSDYGKSSAWTFGNSGSYLELDAPKSDVLYRDKVKARKAVLPDLEFYTTLSRYLPAWAYIYLTPANERVSIPIEDGRRTFLRFPVMLHQGRMLLFVEPTPSKERAGN